MGTILANCVFTEIYLTNGPEACAKQVMHSRASVIVCDTRQRFNDKFQPLMTEILRETVVKAVIFC